MAAKTKTREQVSALISRMSGDGHVVPSNGPGLLRYWRAEQARGKFAMSRDDFVGMCRTMIDSGKLKDVDRRHLVRNGFPELDL